MQVSGKNGKQALRYPQELVLLLTWGDGKERPLHSTVLEALWFGRRHLI
jgi:hypothetical protein